MPDDDRSLRGRTILVTGAGRGLGHGVARGLPDYGATVLGRARSDVGRPELTNGERQSGGAIETFVTDLGNPAAINTLTQEITQRHGGVDAIINNAAILRLIPFLDLDAADFDETIAVNLLAPVCLIRAFLPT